MATVEAGAENCLQWDYCSTAVVLAALHCIVLRLQAADIISTSNLTQTLSSGGSYAGSDIAQHFKIHLTELEIFRGMLLKLRILCEYKYVLLNM